MSDEDSSSKSSRTRSPAYPAIDLEEALQKAQVLWKKAARHPVTIDLLNSYWGLDAKSSAGVSASSAMKKFGLLTEEGAKTNRTLRLSELGVRLVYTPDFDSPEFGKALKTAALSPAIHQELWTKYEGNLPDDGFISRYLVVERRFNQSYVSSFIDQFRRTITFAKLVPGDVLALENGAAAEPLAPLEPSRAVTPATPVVLAPTRIMKPPLPIHQSGSAASAELNEIALPLDMGQVVKIPIPMSEESFELLLATLNLWKRRIVKEPRQIP